MSLLVHLFVFCPVFLCQFSLQDPWLDYIVNIINVITLEHVSSREDREQQLNEYLSVEISFNGTEMFFFSQLWDCWDKQSGSLVKQNVQFQLLCNKIVEIKNKYQCFSTDLHIVQNIIGLSKGMKTKLPYSDFPKALSFSLYCSSVTQVKGYVGKKLCVWFIYL